MPTKKKSPYNGELNEYLPSVSFETVMTWTREDFERHHDEYNDAAKRRILLLFEHYGIGIDDERRWMRLAVRLARDHVSGLQTRPRVKSGRPREWDDFKLLDLLDDVTELVEKKKNFTPHSACMHLAKQVRYRSDREASGEALGKTLYRRYQDISSKIKSSPDFRAMLLWEQNVVQFPEEQDKEQHRLEAEREREDDWSSGI